MVVAVPVEPARTVEVDGAGVRALVRYEELTQPVRPFTVTWTQVPRAEPVLATVVPGVRTEITELLMLGPVRKFR